VKDIVSKAVAGLAAAGGVAVAASADGAPAPFEPAAEESTGGVPDTFGFGSSGADGDGFGF
jgi:hypothetical protein